MKKNILVWVLLSTPAALACGTPYGPEFLTLFLGLFLVLALPHLLSPWLAVRSIGARLGRAAWGIVVLLAWLTSLLTLLFFHDWLGYWLGLLLSWAVGASLSQHFHRDEDSPPEPPGTGLNQSQ